MSKKLEMKSNNEGSECEMDMPVYEEVQKILSEILNSECSTARCSLKAASFLMELRA